MSKIAQMAFLSHVSRTLQDIKAPDILPLFFFFLTFGWIFIAVRAFLWLHRAGVILYLWCAGF